MFNVMCTPSSKHFEVHFSMHYIPTVSASLFRILSLGQMFWAENTTQRAGNKWFDSGLFTRFQILREQWLTEKERSCSGSENDDVNVLLLGQQNVTCPSLIRLYSHLHSPERVQKHTPQRSVYRLMRVTGHISPISSTVEVFHTRDDSFTIVSLRVEWFLTDCLTGVLTHARGHVKSLGLTPHDTLTYTRTRKWNDISPSSAVNSGRPRVNVPSRDARNLF